MKLLFLLNFGGGLEEVGEGPPEMVVLMVALRTVSNWIGMPSFLDLNCFFLIKLMIFIKLTAAQDPNMLASGFDENDD